MLIVGLGQRPSPQDAALHQLDIIRAHFGKHCRTLFARCWIRLTDDSERTTYLATFHRHGPYAGTLFDALQKVRVERVCLRSDPFHIIGEKFQVLRIIETLKNVGVRISLDDFGTGYSSLSCLKRLPIDDLKIDQSFVRDLTSDPDDAAICTTVIGLAHNLKLTVIAEGVETEGQMAYLRRHNCDEMQGYYFSRPPTRG